MHLGPNGKPLQHDVAAYNIKCKADIQGVKVFYVKDVRFRRKIRVLAHSQAQANYTVQSWSTYNDIPACLEPVLLKRYYSSKLKFVPDHSVLQLELFGVEPVGVSV